jgi:CheY-like chemotaxis protein
VLIVDDDFETREMYAWCMKAAGWFVQTVANGAEALIAAPEIEPDVIVMDLHLPVLNGLDAIRRIKLEEATKHVPIVACTGFDRRSSEIEAKDAGCEEFVAKPCEPEALRNLLQTLVARRGGSPSRASPLGSRPAYSFTICIRDDDLKRYELQATSDATAIMNRVAAAVARGRHLRCYVLAADARSREREERYLASRGYSQAAVTL